MPTVKVGRTEGLAATVNLELTPDEAIDLVNFLGAALDHTALRQGANDYRFNHLWQRKVRLLEMIYDARREALRPR